MNKAKFVGMVRDRYSPAVHLFYEYRGYEYMITDEHNGYSESMAVKHKTEQNRIDRRVDGKPKEPYRYEDSADYGFDLLWKYFESGEWDEDEQEKT